MSRIGVELPDSLLDRLAAQAEMVGTSRAYLIESAVTGLVNEFEAIDAECGRPCTCRVGDRPGPHLVRCHWLAP